MQYRRKVHYVVISSLSIWLFVELIFGFSKSRFRFAGSCFHPWSSLRPALYGCFGGCFGLPFLDVGGTPRCVADI